MANQPKADHLSNTCPECGAKLAQGASCQEIFDSFLALEFTDPGYGEVHFLTVACFMVQHGRYSDAGLAWIARKLRSNLEDGVPADVIRRQANREADQTTRTWKVTRPPGAPRQAFVPWSLTIADVAARYQDAASYRSLITQWVRATLEEMQGLVR